MQKQAQKHIHHVLSQNAESISKKAGIKLSPSSKVAAAAKSITGDQADIVDLQGWATVSAISLFHLNEAIVNQKKSPTSYSQSMLNKEKVAVAKVSGDFGPWQLAPTGNSGSTISFHIPLKNQVFEIEGLMGGTYKYDDFTLHVELQAEFIETGVNHEVKKELKTQQSSKDAISPVVIINSNVLTKIIGKKLDDPIGASSYPTMLEDWLNANLDQFQAVLSTVDFSMDYPDGTMSWIKPSATDYAVVEPSVDSTLKNSRLGVMTLIDGEKIGDTLLASEIPLNVIPVGSDAGFAISQEKFVKHMLLPAAPMMFSNDPANANSDSNDGPSQDDFHYSEELYAVTNVNDVTMRKLRLDNGDIVSPTIKVGDFSIGVNGRFLTFNIKTQPFAFSFNTNVTLNYSARYGFAYDKNANDGKGGIGINTSHVTCSATPKTDGWFEDVELVMAIGGLVLAAVGGVAAIGAYASSVGAGIEGAEAGGETLTALDGSVEMNGADPDPEDPDGSGEDSEPGVKARSVTKPKGDPNKIEKPKLSIMKKGALGIHKMGLPFKQVGYACLGLGVAGTVFVVSDGVHKMYDDEELANMQTNFLEKATSALQSTVAWPDTGSDFQIKSVELNHAMQFGFEAVSKSDSK